MSGTIEIRPVTTRKDRTDFIRVTSHIYHDDPAFVAPLEIDMRQRLDPAKNPVLEESPHRLWIALKNGKPAGRIAAIVNHACPACHRDKTGHFGFPEMTDDADVAAALMQTASGWLKSRGMEKIAGPFSFSVNEECGLLVDGFDTPPCIMMPHGKPWYARHLERLGFTGVMEAFALVHHLRRDFMPQKRLDFVNRVLARTGARIRNISMENFKDEIALIVDIYNDAWAGNWGYVPMSGRQADHMASALRPLISRHNVVICETDGAPAAFGLVLPDINSVTGNFNGRLLPFNWIPLVWKLKTGGVRRLRMPLMGVRRHLHGTPAGMAFACKIIDMVNTANLERGAVRAELSWILETNTEMLRILFDMGCTVYKKYRFYEKPL